MQVYLLLLDTPIPLIPHIQICYIGCPLMKDLQDPLGIAKLGYLPQITSHFMMITLDQICIDNNLPPVSCCSFTDKVPVVWILQCHIGFLSHKPQETIFCILCCEFCSQILVFWVIVGPFSVSYVVSLVVRYCFFFLFFFSMS